MTGSDVISTCVALLVTLSVLGAAGEQRPKFDGLKLRQVDAIGARQRANTPIKDLAEGAKSMHESLFVDDKRTRCAAYAYLFKLIKRQTDGGDHSEQIIKQDVVESLATDVASEGPFYVSLFEPEAKSSLAGDEFVEAAELLERHTDQRAKDAWLELIWCLSSYIRFDAKLAAFLDEARRAQALEDLRKFKAIPVAPTNGMVAYLAGRISGDTPKGRSICGRLLSDQVLERAHAQITALDSPQTAELRANFVAPNPQECMRPLPLPAAQSLQPELEGVGQPEEFELLVPVAERRRPAERGVFQFDEAQLAILEFIKMRVNMFNAPSASKARVSIQLALDYLIHYDDLKKAKLDPTSALGKQAISFLQEPSSARVYERVDKAVDDYVRMVSLVAELKMRESKLDTIEELRVALGQLRALLEGIDEAFDVDDVKRMHSLWQAKCRQYSVIDKFINSK